MKPTIVNALFGGDPARRACSSASRCSATSSISAFQLDAEGWRKLTLRWGLFFLFLAVLNEVVWRNFSTDIWVAFKVWGIMPITIVFTLTQMPLIMRHTLPEEDGKAAK